MVMAEVKAVVRTITNTKPTIQHQAVQPAKRMALATVVMEPKVRAQTVRVRTEMPPAD